MLTLQECITEEKIQQELARQQVPQWQQEIEKYRHMISQCTERWQLRERQDFYKRIEHLEKSIEEVTCTSTLTEYEERIRPFLQEQERQRDNVAMHELYEKSQKNAALCVGNKRPRNDTVATSVSKRARVDTLHPITLAFPDMVTCDKNASAGTITTTTTTSSSSSINNNNAAGGKKELYVNLDPLGNQILEDYLHMIRNAAPKVRIVEQDVCEECQEPMVFDTVHAILACLVCGTSSRYIDATSASTAYGDEVEFQSYSYQRSHHFNEKLTHSQAKEPTQVDKSILDKVMQVLLDQGLKLEEIEPHHVQMALKKKKLPDYYKHVMQIWSRITGKPPPRMTPIQEEKMRLMFRAIQAPFEKHCPATRTNFLNYAYCLYRFNELLGYRDFLPYFPLLKGKEKLQRQNEIWKLICMELNWEIPPDCLEEEVGESSHDKQTSTTIGISSNVSLSYLS
jgi:hypothetical protein